MNKIIILFLFLFFSNFPFSNLCTQCPCVPSSLTPCTCECSKDYVDCSIIPEFTPKYSETIGGYWRVIKSNGIPNHAIGIFPLLGATSTESCCCGRPRPIQEQDYVFVMPAFSHVPSHRWRRDWVRSKVYFFPKPPFEGKPESSFGVAVNGIPFDPAAAEWWDEDHQWTLNPLTHPEMRPDLDCNNGHVQPDGGYHYHGFPNGLVDTLKEELSNATLPNGDPDLMARGRDLIILLGWAFDGNPIYGETCGEINNSMSSPQSGYRLHMGPRGSDAPSEYFPRGWFVEDYYYAYSSLPPSGILDECNGHIGPTPEFPNGVYHYHILKHRTLAVSPLDAKGFPYIGRCWRLFSYDKSPDIFPISD